jgi:hypothetical protein
MGVADVGFEITHLSRANSVNNTLAKPENVAELAHSRLLLQFVAKYPRQCEKLTIPSGDCNFAQAADPASCIAQRYTLREPHMKDSELNRLAQGSLFVHFFALADCRQIGNHFTVINIYLHLFENSSISHFGSYLDERHRN